MPTPFVRVANIKDPSKLNEFLTVNSKEHFNRVTDALEKSAINWQLDTNLVRGLDYYSHTAFEFVTPSITHLSDTPANLGSANQILKMNSGGTALEWGTDDSGGGGITVQDARNGLSHTQNSASGSGSFSYTASTGVMTYTPPDLSGFASSTNGTATRSGYVNGTSSNSPFNQVGTYIWASGTIGNTSTEYNNGADASGSTIYPAGAISFDTGGGNVAIDVSSSSLGSGTWKAMGQIKNLGTSATGNYMQHRHTLWLRIA